MCDTEERKEGEMKHVTFLPVCLAELLALCLSEHTMNRFCSSAMYSCTYIQCFFACVRPLLKKIGVKNLFKIFSFDAFSFYTRIFLNNEEYFGTFWNIPFQNIQRKFLSSTVAVITIKEYASQFR